MKYHFDGIMIDMYISMAAQCHNIATYYLYIKSSFSVVFDTQSGITCFIVVNTFVIQAYVERFAYHRQFFG